MAVTIALEEAVRIEVDGTDDELSILVEARAHQGPPKVGQKHKVLADALKLIHVAASLPVAPRLALCLSDPEAARVAHDVRNGFVSVEAAARDYGVVVDPSTVDVDPAATARLREVSA